MASIIEKFDRAYARHGDDPDKIAREMRDPFVVLETLSDAMWNTGQVFAQAAQDLARSEMYIRYDPEFEEMVSDTGRRTAISRLRRETPVQTRTITVSTPTGRYNDDRWIRQMLNSERERMMRDLIRRS